MIEPDRCWQSTDKLATNNNAGEVKCKNLARNFKLSCGVRLDARTVKLPLGASAVAANNQCRTIFSIWHSFPKAPAARLWYHLRFCHCQRRRAKRFLPSQGWAFTVRVFLGDIIRSEKKTMRHKVHRGATHANSQNLVQTACWLSEGSASLSSLPDFLPFEPWQTPINPWRGFGMLPPIRLHQRQNKMFRLAKKQTFVCFSPSRRLISIRNLSRDEFILPPHILVMQQQPEIFVCFFFPCAFWTSAVKMSQCLCRRWHWHFLLFPSLHISDIRRKQLSTA